MNGYEIGVKLALEDLGFVKEAFFGALGALARRGIGALGRGLGRGASRGATQMGKSVGKVLPRGLSGPSPPAQWGKVVGKVGKVPQRGLFGRTIQGIQRNPRKMFGIGVGAGGGATSAYYGMR